MEKENNKPTQSSLFPRFSILCQTSADLIELCFILCALLLKPISLTFRWDKKKIPLKARLEIGVYEQKVWFTTLNYNLKAPSALSFPPLLFTFWLLVLLLMLRWAANEKSSWNGLSQRSPLPFRWTKQRELWERDWYFLKVASHCARRFEISGDNDLGIGCNINKRGNSFTWTIWWVIS